MMVGSGFIWLRIGYSSGQFRKRWRNSWPTQWSSAFSKKDSVVWN